ncbi:MAG: lipid A biosynthesis acyltransferase [Bacteroidota bacterium]
MSKWKGKTRGGLTGHKIFMNILKYLGLPFAYFFLRFVVLYFFLFSIKSTKNIYSFYRNRIKFGWFKSIISVYKNYYIFGQTLLDKTAFFAGINPNFTFDFEGEEYIKQMVENKTGGLLISAHIGNFEIAGHMLKRIEGKVHIVLYDAEHQKIKEYFNEKFDEKFANMIPIKDDMSHIYAIAKAFENKEIVCMHGDRFLPGTKTLSADFLGKEASFPTGPLYLATKFNVPVSYVFAMKETNIHYHFNASIPKIYKYPGNLKMRNLELQNMIKDYVFSLEKMMNKYPEQWFNYYDFWD